MMKNYPVRIRQSSAFITNDAIKPPKLLIILFCHDCVALTEWLVEKDSAGIPPNTKRYLNWVKTSVCDRFYIFSCFQVLFRCMLLYKIHFSWHVIKGFQKSLLLRCGIWETAMFMHPNLFRLVKSWVTHMSSLETYPSFFKWQSTIQLSTFSLVTISSVIICWFSFTKVMTTSTSILGGYPELIFESEIFLVKFAYC